jgi:3-isopropylmalate/(R)-2-methylmalate dehydratase small subunit
MKPFIKHTGRVVAMDRANVDTDQIIPKQFLKRIERTGFGEFLFWDWARHEDGSPRPEFELNKPEARGASVLLTRRNFGCGSSREHAPWALEDWGFRVLVAPSFADIFYNNCFKNGMLPITLPEDQVRKLMRHAQEEIGYKLLIDLEKQIIEDTGGLSIPFAIGEFQRYCLLEGLDDIGLTLRHEDLIKNYESTHASRW